MLLELLRKTLDHALLTQAVNTLQPYVVFGLLAGVHGYLDLVKGGVFFLLIWPRGKNHHPNKSKGCSGEPHCAAECEEPTSRTRPHSALMPSASPNQIVKYLQNTGTHRPNIGAKYLS